MARHHVAVAFGAALVAMLTIWQLLLHFGSPLAASWAQGVHGIPFGLGKDALLNGTNTTAAGSEYLVGVGKADITGPVVEINMMGYADPDQLGSGVRQRLYSRAFIVGNPQTPSDRFVYLVLDTQSGDTAIRYGILQGLVSMGDEYAVYGEHNVAVTGTHSHAGPGAWLNYLLPQITSKGFNNQSYRAIVDGTILSIKRAHESLTEGTLAVGTTNISDANISRSPYAYLANPEEQRAQYSDNVDKSLTLLRFQRSSDGKDIGVLTWFAVHGTSLLGNNTLIAGDNKGVAAYLLEQDLTANGDNVADGFVAGFSQANVGDTSPNINGAYCESGVDEGKQCSFERSLCGNDTKPCHGRGPAYGLNDGGAQSCFEIGRRQYAGARSLYDSMQSSSTFVSGNTVRALHTFVDLSNYTFPLPNGTIVRTCPAALGYSFAAGTTDGPGAFDFKQGDSGAPDANPLWAAVSGLIHEPSPEQRACHGAKPILLDVGETTKPYMWSPNIVDIQILRVGQLMIIVSPGEATTMSGRRWRSAVASHAVSTRLLTDSNIITTPDPIVVLGGPANSYTHYIATEEEYNIQRYEGASTLYGPHTLNAYINLTLSNMEFLSSATTAKPAIGPLPPINVNRSLSFITPVVRDGTPLFKSFGDVLTDVNSAYRRGDNISAVFVGANPRNNLRLEGTFAAVERYDPDTSVWTHVRSDEDWELVYSWTRKSTILATSEVKIWWETSDGTPAGRYRLRYYGDAKSLTGTITAFYGTSGAFDLV